MSIAYMNHTVIQHLPQRIIQHRILPMVRHQIQVRVNKSDWSAYDQSNDYSFDASYTSFTEYNKITIYRNGTLIWGAPGHS
jgi:hypothetical protein